MKEFVILTDNGSDLSEDLAKKNEIEIMYLTVNVNDEEYDGINKKISPETIYNLMKKGVSPSTSQVNPEKAELFFESYLKNGQDIIQICLSGKISGTYNSCKIAAMNLKEKYPERRIEVIDSISASMGLGFLVMKAVQKKNQGKNFEEILKYIETIKHKICHIFTVSDLVYLQRGGRISKAEAVIGSLIGIKPVLSCDSEGKLVPIYKVRGRKNALISMVNKMEEIIEINKNDFVTISHGNCLEEAEFVAKMIRDKFNIKNIFIEPLGPIIGSHSGPGTLAIFFIADHRLDKK